MFQLPVMRVRSKVGLLLAVVAMLVMFDAQKAEAAAPIGHVDEISASGVIKGWAIDPDANGWHLQVHAYFDGPAGTSQKVVGSSTNLPRCDVKFDTSINECGFGRGFEIAIPADLKNGKNHTVHVYALNVKWDNQAGYVADQPVSLLPGSPKTFKLGNANARHARATLVSHNGTIYFLGEVLRYPFPNKEVFLSWSGDFKKVVPATAGDLAMPLGPVVEMKFSNRKPIGNVDGYNSSSMSIKGWAADPDRPSEFVDLHIYIDGPAGSGRVPQVLSAGGARADVNAATGLPGSHGFTYYTPMMYDSFTHQAFIYAIDKNDTTGQSNVLLNGSPVSFTSTAAVSPWIDSFAANPYSTEPGKPVTLTWATSNATSVTLNPSAGGILPLSGSIVVYPTADTVYTLTAYDSAGKTDTLTEEVYVVTAAQTRDIQRLTDLVTILTALEEHYSISREVPSNLSQLVPSYMGAVPVPPAAAQTCTPDQNKYVYQKTAATGISLTYCLEEGYPTTEFFKKGVNTYVYTVTSEAVVKPRDARRISDVRQLMTALELHYNDNGSYPGSLAALSPTFLSALPVAPTPVDGNCTAVNNTYVYQQKSSGQGYGLTFCLGMASGGYAAGQHTASENGIQ